MRLLKLLDTEGLKETLTSNYERLSGHVTRELKVRFERHTPQSPDGYYVFADKMGYHFVLSERGDGWMHRVTDDVFELNFWVLYDAVVIGSALDYIEATECAETFDERHARLQAKKLKLLSLVGENYRKRGEIEVDELLAFIRMWDEQEAQGREGGAAKVRREDQEARQEARHEPACGQSRGVAAQEAADYHEYTVIKDIPGVQQVEVAPWFGQPGGGTQYRLPDTIERLKDAKFLR
jgi:hypothetical protein